MWRKEAVVMMRVDWRWNAESGLLLRRLVVVLVESNGMQYGME
jgi:hypothetical protein